MKKILLGTTTLVSAAALFAGAAMAEAPKVTLGGTIDWQVGIMSDDQDDDRTGTLEGESQRAQAFRNDTEITVAVDGKADNGLGYGALIELEADVEDDADSEGTNASRTFIYMEGSWGRVELGSNYGPQRTMEVDAGTIARATGGIDGDWYYYANNLGGAPYILTPDLPLDHGQFGTTFGGFGLGAGFPNEAQENVNKIVYYTPRFSGFQLGLAYAPNDRDRGQLLDRTDTNVARSEEIFMAGVNWEGKWDQLGIKLAATGEMGDAESALYEDLGAWNAGAKLTWGGFSLAGSYGDWDESNRLKATANVDDNDYWTLGGAYEHGPYGISVTYLTSDYDNGGATTDNEFDNLVVGADYKLAPGLTPYAEISFYDFDATGVDDDNDGTVFILGTQLNF